MQEVLIVVGYKYKSKILLTLYNAMNTNLIYGGHYEKRYI